MRKSLLRVLTASLVLTSLTFAPTAWAASPYDSPPSDLKAYEAELLKKLITVRWGLSYGVGFAGKIRG
jgi:hypothetical protein